MRLMVGKKKSVTKLLYQSEWLVLRLEREEIEAPKQMRRLQTNDENEEMKESGMKYVRQ